MTFVDFIPLVRTSRQLRIIGDQHPTNFRDLRRDLEAIRGDIDSATRKQRPGRQVNATTIAELERRLALLSERYEKRQRLVEKWAWTAKVFPSTGAPSFSPARPPGAPSR